MHISLFFADVYSITKKIVLISGTVRILVHIWNFLYEHL